MNLGEHLHAVAALTNQVSLIIPIVYLKPFTFDISLFGETCVCGFCLEFIICQVSKCDVCGSSPCLQYCGLKGHGVLTHIGNSTPSPVLIMI